MSTEQEQINILHALGEGLKLVVSHANSCVEKYNYLEQYGIFDHISVDNDNDSGELIFTTGVGASSITWVIQAKDVKEFKE